MNRPTVENEIDNLTYKDLYGTQLKFKLNENSKIRILHTNIRSLNQNNTELKAFLKSSKIEFDIVCLSEVWETNINTYKDLLEGYDMY